MPDGMTLLRVLSASTRIGQTRAGEQQMSSIVITYALHVIPPVNKFDELLTLHISHNGLTHTKTKLFDSVNRALLFYHIKSSSF